MDREQGQRSTVLILVVLLLVVMALTACSTTVPVTARFPEPPGRAALTACPQLERLSDTATLSDISRVINSNYALYYQCAVKADAWIEWYTVQKKIFETSGK